MSFGVGVNQIELGAHGVQDYRFYPELRHFEAAFTNIHATADGLIGGFASLAPESGPSITTFHSVSEGQDGFFPSVWGLSLHLRFQLQLGPIRFSLFNRAPLRYETSEPLTGFPPVTGPAFVLQDDVGLHLGSPRGPRVATIQGGSTIEPVVRATIDINAPAAELDAGDAFAVEVEITPRGAPRRVRAHYALVPTRGVELSVPKNGSFVLDTSHVLPITGRVTDRAEPHLGVAVRCWSAVGDDQFFNYAEVELGTDESHRHVAEGPTEFRSGEPVAVGLSDVATAEYSEVFWIAPHGYVLDDPHAATVRFAAPNVDYPQKTWLTAYTRTGGVTSPPYRHVFTVIP